MRKDGVEIPVELVVVATRHEDRPTFMAYMRDLSEQKRTEAALRASEARFQAAAASMPDGLVILDPEDRIVFYNSRHPELLPPALREGLALGIRFEDWIRDGLARGPIYHPDMGVGLCRAAAGFAHAMALRSASTSILTAAGCGSARRPCPMAGA